MVLELVERTCARCKITAPEVFFPRRDASGKPRSWCWDCRSQAAREYYVANRERDNANRKEARKRRLADPEYRQRQRAYDREKGRQRRATAKGRAQLAAAAARYRAKANRVHLAENDRIAYRLRNERAGKSTNTSPAPRPRERIRLTWPAAPFVAWVQERMERKRYEINPLGMARFDDAGIEGATLQALDVNPRAWYGWIHGERKRVHIDVVDRAVTRDGSALLSDIYPELGP